MIERCAVGHLTHPPCNMCRVCSLLLKISWKGSSERSFGKPYISCIGYTRRSVSGTSQLPSWHGTVGAAFFYLGRLLWLVGAEMRTHKEGLQ
jgi:hypothetical protein